MKKNRLLSLLLLLQTAFAVSAQFTPTCPTPPPPAPSYCNFTCVYCNLDGTTGTNINPINDSGNVICGQITKHNPVWYGFVAGSTSIYFSIETSNCFQGDGLQAAIFTSCDATDAFICNPGSSGLGGMPIEIGIDNFNVGSTYYLMIDGFAGDVCDYQINVIQGSTIAPPVGSVSIPQGPTQVCPGKEEEYHVDPVANAGYLQWTAPAGSKINGGGNNLILPAIWGGSVYIAFGSTPGDVCVTAGNACSTQTPSACLPVQINSPIPPTVLPPLTVPFNQLPFVWDQNGQTLTSPGVFGLQVNFPTPSGCDSIVKQVITIEQPQAGYVKGVVFWDADQDGVRDVGEMPYTAGAVVETASGQFTSTNADGEFVFQNVANGDTIRANPPQNGLNVLPAFRLKQANVWEGYNFGLNPAPLNYDLQTSIVCSILRPGFNSTIMLFCFNAGPTNVPDPVITATIPFNLLNLIELAPANADVTIVGNTLVWKPGSLTANQSGLLSITVKVPAGTMLGTQVILKATAMPIADDQNPANNFYTCEQNIVGSYDPNDKQVTPAYVTPALLSSGQPFEYTVRFQNTGNYPAEMVRVVDSLGSTVDPGSFRFIAASHPCSWKISGNGVVEFLFSNIQLPDSASNETASHGFVRFTVQPRKNLPLGTVIQNYCDIYFDFNPPVRTNTAGTKVVYFLPGTGLSIRDELILRPNPAAFYVFCDWRTPAPASGRIRLFDLGGLSRLEATVTEGQQSAPLDVSQLKPGLYFALLEAGNLVLSNKVVIVSPGILGGN